MNRIDAKFGEVLGRGEKILVCEVPMGDPDLKASRELAGIYLEAGADIVELGMPSRNPGLDGQVGQVIVESNRRSFRAEEDLSKYFETIKAIRKDFPDDPLYVMAYWDIAREYGMARLVDALREAGMDGFFLHAEAAPDIEQEADRLLKPLGIHRIRLMPFPFNKRMLADMGENARGFIVLQTIADRFGDRTRVAEENQESIELIRATGTEAAVVLAFGISAANAKQAVELDPDGILAGSALIRHVASHDYDAVAREIQALKAATIP